MNHPVSNTIEADGFLIASATDVGRLRTANEDSHALWVGEDAAVRAKRGMLLVVCDGMGGASAGEIASQIAVTTVVERVRANESTEPAEVLREAIEAANEKVHAQAAANAEQHGMGTTCTAVLLRGREVWVGHVGDSRAYLVRSGQVRRVTKDHSLVAELIEQGHLTAAEAKHDARRNVVTRSVGALEHVQVDAERVVERLEPGDVLMICSDGLHGQLADADIVRIVGKLPPAEACASLIDLANERGGPDNITAIVVRFGGAASATRIAPGSATKEPGRKLPPHLGLLVVAAVVMALLVVGVGLMLFGQLKQPRAVPATAEKSAADPARVVATRPVDGEVRVVPPPATPPNGPRGAGRLAHPEAAVAAPPPAASIESPALPVPAASSPEPSVRRRPGTVQLMTRPFQPSTFMIDGQPYAEDVGFLTQSLPAGDHVVHVEGVGGASVDVPVHVESGGSYSLVAELPSSGTLGNIEIVLLGAGRAQVLVDGAQYPEPAPCVVRGLAPGAHSIRVMRPRSDAPQGPAEVQVTAGSTARAEYRFGAGH